MTTQMWMVQNLNCPTCAAKVEKAVQKMPGVQSARVGFATGTVRIEYNETQVTAQEIQHLIGQFGLTVTGVLPGGS